MMGKMNKKEMLIMTLLRINSRESLTSMSKLTKIPVSTIYDKIKMHQKKTIKKHTCILDFSKLGFNSRAALSIKTNSSKKEELKEYLIKHPNVNTIYKINNGFDFWIECIFKNIKDLEDFIEYVEAKFNAKKQVFYIIDDIKREAFMTNLELINSVNV
jgi:DNA-binding Lrp family transcriptional regulator